MGVRLVGIGCAQGGCSPFLCKWGRDSEMMRTSEGGCVNPPRLRQKGVWNPFCSVVADVCHCGTSCGCTAALDSLKTMPTPARLQEPPTGERTCHKLPTAVPVPFFPKEEPHPLLELRKRAPTNLSTYLAMLWKIFSDFLEGSFCLCIGEQVTSGHPILNENGNLFL